MIELLAYGIAAMLTAVCVVIHYAAMRCLYRSSSLERSRFGVLLIVAALFAIHVVEIWTFALAYFLLSGTAFGSIATDSLLDCLYFSASGYTTLGLGDVFPIGAVRAIAGTEGLLGLVLIAWSASFTFLQMQRLWDEGSGGENG